jgi:hypothetical protein
MSALTAPAVLKVNNFHRTQAALGTPGLNNADPVFIARQHAAMDLILSSVAASNNNYLTAVRVQPLAHVVFSIRRGAKLASDTTASYYLADPEFWAAYAEGLNNLSADMEALLNAEVVSV